MLLCVAGGDLRFHRDQHLHRRPPADPGPVESGVRQVNIVAAVAAGLGVLIGVLMALFYRTSTGVIVAAGILCVYGVVLNGPEDYPRAAGAGPTRSSLTFMLATPDVEGAELYVNGVHLGTLPYETTYDEFHRKVPFWENEPNELKVANLRSWLHVPVRWHPGSSEPSTKLYPPWAEITVPKARRSGTGRLRASKWSEKQAHTMLA